MYPLFSLWFVCSSIKEAQIGIGTLVVDFIPANICLHSSTILLFVVLAGVWSIVAWKDHFTKEVFQIESYLAGAETWMVGAADGDAHQRRCRFCAQGFYGPLPCDRRLSTPCERCFIFHEQFSGVGGNFVAVQASRISTELHQAMKQGKEAFSSAILFCNPLRAFFSSGDRNRFISFRRRQHHSASAGAHLSASTRRLPDPSAHSQRFVVHTSIPRLVHDRRCVTG